MKRFWRWVVDQKINTVRKWQSLMLHLDSDDHQHNTAHLKHISGSVDELGRKQRGNSGILQEDDGNFLSSISLQNFDVAYDSEPIDFDGFFAQSSVAIESALVIFISVLFVFHFDINQKKISFTFYFID